MPYDVEDVFAGAFGSVIAKSLIFAAAVWIGCSLGVAGFLAGALAHGQVWRSEFSFWLWASPIYLVSYWGIPNLAFLLVSLTYFILSERSSYLAWGVVLGVESLVVMAGWAHVFGKNPFGITIAWLVWIALLIMIETGVWLVRSIIVSSWARRLGTLRAENARHHAAKNTQESAADQPDDETDPKEPLA